VKTARREERREIFAANARTFTIAVQRSGAANKKREAGRKIHGRKILNAEIAEVRAGLASAE